MQPKPFVRGPPCAKLKCHHDRGVQQRWCRTRLPKMSPLLTSLPPRMRSHVPRQEAIPKKLPIRLLHVNDQCQSRVRPNMDRLQRESESKLVLSRINLLDLRGQSHANPQRKPINRRLALQSLGPRQYPESLALQQVQSRVRQNIVSIKQSPAPANRRVAWRQTGNRSSLGLPIAQKGSSRGPKTSLRPSR